MAEVFWDSTGWVSSDPSENMQPQAVHVWSDTWTAESFNNRGGAVVPSIIAVPITMSGLPQLSTQFQFMEGNSDGYALVFNVTNVGTTPISEYVVHFGYIG
jgi:hypothetical protein